jgi:hypothetical protein
MKRIALVTCRVLPEPDPDQDLLLDALRRASMDARMLAWDDPAGDPGAYDLCVMRSCWDYYRDPDAFLAWVATAARDSRLLNSEAVVHWNIHKRYLARLESAGVPIIPTAWFARGERVDMEAVIDEKGWDDIVVKPAVSAASFRTRRFGRDDLSGAQAFVDALLSERDAMAQQYIPGFETTAERALVWIDGQFTHAVCKHPRFDGEDERVSEALPISDEERALGERALGCVETDLLYARVDVVDHDGKPVVSEFELIEPSLFLLQYPPALDRLVSGIGAVVG